MKKFFDKIADDIIILLEKIYDLKDTKEATPYLIELVFLKHILSEEIDSKKYDEMKDKITKILEILFSVDTKTQALIMLLGVIKCAVENLSEVTLKDGSTYNYDFWQLIMRLYSYMNETQPEQLVEDVCIVCGKKIMVEKDKKGFANICKLCK